MTLWTADKTENTPAVSMADLGREFVEFLNIGINGHRRKMAARRTAANERQQSAPMDQQEGSNVWHISLSARCFSR